MNIPNRGILNPKVSDPDGYVTKDLMWAAIPYGNKFVIIHNGQQVHTSNSIATAKTYIQNQIKLNKKKK